MPVYCFLEQYTGFFIEWVVGDKSRFRFSFIFASELHYGSHLQ
jgi:hypothetical protein